MKKRKIIIILSISILLTLVVAVPNVLSQVKRGAAVTIDQVPEKLKKLDIKDYFIASDFKKVGIIHAIRGTVVVIHKATGKAYFGMEGDYIHENDVLETLAKSRCRVRLFNEDVISMAPDSNLAVDEVAFSRKKRVKRSFFSMLKGKVMFYSLRLFSFRKSYAKLKTPTAVVGVRGTKFGVYVYWEDEEKQAKGPIQVADLGNDMGMYLAKAGPGEGGKPNFKAHFEDGDGYVDEKDVPAGSTYDSKTDKTYPTDPTYAEGFEKETSVEEKPKPGKPPKPPAETGKQDPSSGADTNEDIVDTNQEQTTGGVPEPEVPEPEVPEPEPPPSGQYGYFTALLSLYYVEDSDYDSTYRSTSRQDFEGDTVEGDNLSYKMVNTGKGEWKDDADGPPYLKSVQNLDGSSGDLGTDNCITVEELGSNDYLKWGYWYVEDPFSIGESSYAVNHYNNDRQGYYIFGTNPADIGALSGTYTYTGNAYGTMYEVGEVSQNVAMGPGTSGGSGSFNCTLNFTSGSITDFDLTVSGGGYTASITNATGSLTTGNNHINLDYTGGTWELSDGSTPVSATYGDVKGSVYGTNGEAVGGVWKMGYSNTYHATGIYQGTRSP